MSADPTTPTPADDSNLLDETPPLLGSWRTIYTVVLLSQAALIALFYGLTRVFA